MKNIKKIIAVTCTLMIAGSDSSIAANALSPETYEAIAYNCRNVEDPYYVL